MTDKHTSDILAQLHFYSFILPRNTETIPLMLAFTKFMHECLCSFAAFWGMQNHQKIVTPVLLAQRSALLAIPLLEYTLAEPANIFCDSAYVVSVTNHFETATKKSILDASKLIL